MTATSSFAIHVYGLFYIYCAMLQIKMTLSREVRYVMLMCEHSVRLIRQVVCKSIPPITLFRAQIDVPIFPPSLCSFLHARVYIYINCVPVVYMYCQDSHLSVIRKQRALT